jgi:hypothetical protein
MRYLALYMVVALILGCGEFVCDSTHPAVGRARSLTPEEFAALDAYIYELKTSGGTPGPSAMRPAFVRKLHPLEIRTGRCGARADACMKLAGCFDEFVFLNFAWRQGRRTIEVEWSEGPNKLGTEVLWSAKG